MTQNLPVQPTPDWDAINAEKKRKNDRMDQQAKRFVYGTFAGTTIIGGAVGTHQAQQEINSSTPVWIGTVTGGLTGLMSPLLVMAGFLCLYPVYGFGKSVVEITPTLIKLLPRLRVNLYLADEKADQSQAKK